MYVKSYLITIIVGDYPAKGADAIDMKTATDAFKHCVGSRLHIDEIRFIIRDTT
jgi:hypothetical protein